MGSAFWGGLAPPKLSVAPPKIFLLKIFLSQFSHFDPFFALLCLETRFLALEREKSRYCEGRNTFGERSERIFEIFGVVSLKVGKKFS